MKTAVSTFRLLDAARDAWPARFVECRSDFCFRASRESSNRGNHAYPITSGASAAPAFGAAARFFGTYGRPVQFLIAEGWDELDLELAEHGFELNNPSVFLIKGAVTDRSPKYLPSPPGVTTTVTRRLTTEWLDAWATCAGLAQGDRDGCFRAVRHVERPSLYAVVRAYDGAPLTVGRSVDSDGWRGIHNLATLVGHRGQGLASHLIAVLESYGDTQSRGRYLQVDGDNPAISLYLRLGYELAFKYHYRCAEASVVSACLLSASGRDAMRSGRSRDHPRRRPTHQKHRASGPEPSGARVPAR